MATTASFKQQCPSCEAMVPIRDSNLIGRKIDCPKCKYRFVVEDPGTADDDEDPKQPKGGEARKKGAVKGKAGARRGEDDDEDSDGKAPAKSGGNNKVILGVALSVVALVLLGVVGYLIWGTGDSGSSSGKSGGGGTAPGTQPATQQAEAPKDETKKDETTAVSNASTEALTNLLPPETEGVSVVHMQDLMRTPIGRAIFDSPGSFRNETFLHRLGFAPNEVDVVVQGWSFSQNWSLNVVHSSTPFRMDAIKAALNAKPVEENKRIEGQEYFLLDNNPWLDMLGQTSFALLVHSDPAKMPARSEPRTLRVYDEQTLIFADLKPMQLFLSKKGVFDKRVPDATAAAPKEAPKEGGAEEGGPGGMAGMMGKMGMGRGGAGGKPMAGMPGMGGNPMEGGQPKPEEPAFAPSGSYLTINPALKTMLDRVEAKQPLISLALDTRAALNGRVPVLGINLFDDKFKKIVFQDASIIGAALHMKDGIVLTLGAGYSREDDAAKHLKSVQKQEGADLAALLTKALETKVEYSEEDPNQLALGQGEGGAPGMGMPGMGMPGMGKPGMGMGGGMGMPGAMAPGLGAGGGQPGAMQPGLGAGGPNRGGGMMDPERRGMGMMGMPGMGRGMGGGMMGGPEQANQEKKPEKPSSTVRASQPEKSLVIITINLIDQAANGKLVQNQIRQLVMQQKGNLDMAGGQMRIHELGVAVRSYPESPPHVGVFPRGTALRPLGSERLGRPYPPNERVSWMAELLPYLGPEQAALHGQIAFDKSWRHEDNLPLAATLVPQFLDPQYPQSSWWAKAPSGEIVGTTHYVGIAGIGMDAAEYSDGDPAVANKVGIFGYDRQTRLADITDKTSNTILLIQVPPTYKRPWMAGGGSTVAGVPETGSVRPFVSTSRDGKRGTHVLMADGSVRFINENISDDVFKSLCTIKGGEPVINLNREAPLVPPPEGQAELKVIEPVVPAPTRPASQSPPNQGAAWKVFTSKEGRFSVSFPGTPKEKTITLNSPFGPVTRRVFSVHVGNDDDYHVGYEDLTVPQGVALDPEKVFEVMRNRVVTFIAGTKVVKEIKFSVENNPGKELVVDMPGHGLARIRLIIANDKAYHFEASGSKTFVESKETDKFFESLKLLSKDSQTFVDPSRERKQGDLDGTTVAVFTKNCASCHTGAMAKGKMQLFKSRGVFNPDAPRDKVLEVLNEGKMPPRTRPPLAASDVAALKKWASATP